jgi:hypothetical protein
VFDIEDDDAIAYVGHNRKTLPPNTEPLAPPARAAARAAAAAPPVPVPHAVPLISFVTEHETPVDGSTNGNTKKRTTEKEDHIDTSHPKKNGSAGGKWRAEGFIAPSQLHK